MNGVHRDGDVVVVGVAALEVGVDERAGSVPGFGLRDNVGERTRRVLELDETGHG